MLIYVFYVKRNTLSSVAFFDIFKGAGIEFMLNFQHDLQVTMDKNNFDVV